MDVNHLRSLVSSDLEAVNTLINVTTQSEINLIEDLASHIIQGGGKRLRPLLLLLSSHACGYLGGDHHIQLAAAVEFFHTATLLHDDVVDESSMRRGRQTANKIWGSKASILVGDYLLTHYNQVLINVGNIKIMQLLTDISFQVGRGELKQLSNRHNTLLTVDEYYEIIRAKTSLVFAACAAIAAIISNAPLTIEQGMYDFGLHLGNAFQLIDDALDYCSDAKTIGKNIGDDLADGKATLPLLHALKHGTPTQQQQIITSLELGTLDYLPEILNAMTETKAIEHTRQAATQEIEQAISTLDILPNSKYKDALIDLAHYAIHRDH